MPQQIAEFIPHILSFLPLGQCAHTAITCSSWNQGANAYGPYRDLRDSIPWQLYKPHQVRVSAPPISLSGLSTSLTLIRSKPWQWSATDSSLVVIVECS
jgi:hypothetical protein